MSVRYTLDSDDHCSCRSSYGNTNYSSISLPVVVRPEYSIVKDKYGDSNYNSASDCSSSYSRITDDEMINRLIGWKIFGTVTLYAWRRRRKDVNEAMLMMDKLKKDLKRTEDQLLVYSTLIRVDQKRNADLTSQLKRALSSLTRANSSCETLSSSLNSIKADKALLEHELKSKYEEYDGLHAVLAQTKTDLFRTMMEQRNLQSQLSNEQRSVQSLENQKNQLINEICELNATSLEKEEHFKCQFEEKQVQLNEIKEKLKILDELKEQFSTEQTHRSNEEKAKYEIQRLRLQVLSLQKKLDSTLSSRLRLLWENLIGYQMQSIRCAHIMVYYLLPATPPPTFF